MLRILFVVAIVTAALGAIGSMPSAKAETLVSFDFADVVEKARPNPPTCCVR